LVKDGFYFAIESINLGNDGRVSKLVRGWLLDGGPRNNLTVVSEYPVTKCLPDPMGYAEPSTDDSVTTSCGVRPCKSYVLLDVKHVISAT
jgi:hypothetical protein